MLNQYLPFTFLLAFGLLFNFHTKGINGEVDEIVLQALEFEYKPKENNVPFYQDKTRKALAINAVIYKDKYSSAVTTFTAKSGFYDIELISMKETDGESSYRILINDELVGEFQNPTTTNDYELNVYSIKNIQVQKGAIIEVEFNTHSNGKIPEGEAFAYSRGRWKEIKFSEVNH